MRSRIWPIEAGDGGSELIVAIEARIDDAGRITITERWRDKSEIWSDGVQVRIPVRIWAQIIRWWQFPAEAKEPFVHPAFPYENPRTPAETEAMLNHMADVHLTPTAEKK